MVLECDSGPFMRATYINQARVHMGYHYPRSFSTAIKSAHYFERFCKDYGFCNLVDFDQAMKRQQLYKTEEGRSMLKLTEGDTHHGGCGQCGGDE